MQTLLRGRLSACSTATTSAPSRKALAPCYSPRRPTQVAVRRAVRQCAQDDDCAQPHNSHPELQEGPLHHLPVSSWFAQRDAGSTSPASASSQRDAAGASSSGSGPASASSASASSASAAHDQAHLFSSLRSNKFWTMTDRPGIDLLAADEELLRRVSQVHVILFGKDENNQEGIYSLRAVCPEGLPEETIIVFENAEDAERYSGLLEVTMEPHTPKVCSISSHELVEFCHDRDYCCRLEPAGSLLMPPDYNVGVTDWERSNKLRSGTFAVLEREPSGESDDMEASAYAPMHAAHPPLSVDASGYPLPGLYAQAADGPGLARYHQPMDEEELDLIRSQLEALLPPPE